MTPEIKEVLPPVLGAHVHSLYIEMTRWYINGVYSIFSVFPIYFSPYPNLKISLKRLCQNLPFYYIQQLIVCTICVLIHPLHLWIIDCGFNPLKVCGIFIHYRPVLVDDFGGYLQHNDLVGTAIILTRSAAGTQLLYIARILPGLEILNNLKQYGSN